MVASFVEGHAAAISAHIDQEWKFRFVGIGLSASGYVPIPKKEPARWDEQLKT